MPINSKTFAAGGIAFGLFFLIGGLYPAEPSRGTVAVSKPAPQSRPVAPGTAHTVRFLSV